jgi:hypothetical protein
VPGKITVEHDNDWHDEECQIATDEKNKAYIKMHQRSYTRASVENYQAERRN